MLGLQISPQKADFEVFNPVFDLRAHLTTLYGGYLKNFQTL